MATATMTSKGQLTIPIEVRRDLGLSEGVRVEFIKTDQEQYTIRAATASVTLLKGILKKPAQPVSIVDMERAINEGANQ